MLSSHKPKLFLDFGSIKNCLETFNISLKKMKDVYSIAKFEDLNIGFIKAYFLHELNKNDYGNAGFFQKSCYLSTNKQIYKIYYYCNSYNNKLKCIDLNTIKIDIYLLNKMAIIYWNQNACSCEN